MKFLIDAQLPPALARWLREAGFEAQAAREVGLRDAEDGTIWRWAAENGCAIITKDEDFALRVQTTAGGPCVVWLRVGNTSNTALREWLVPKVPQIAALLGQGYRLVEIR